MKKYIWIILVVVLIIYFKSCSHASKKNPMTTMTVAEQQTQNILYYSGIIQPKKSVVVTSPADGVIVEMPFQYGETVKSGQLLFLLSSEKFLADYKAALLQYVKAKNEFTTSETMLNEGKFLHEHQLISDDDFKNKQSNYYANQLALLQARDSLEVLLKQLDVKNIDLYNLTIADINKITEAMHLQMSSQHLRIFSPASGIILSQNKNEEEAKKLIKGDAIKQGDVLAIIGDLSGISIRIKVNELTINQLHAGQKVSVSGIAFPNEILTGEIKRVDKQGISESNGLPSFSAEIVVPTITSAQQQMIHVGMSAKIEIHVDEPSQLMIPIIAMKEKNGVVFVKKYNQKLKTFVETEIKTGKTSIDQVVVLSGLKTGDKIAAAYQA